MNGKATMTLYLNPEDIELVEVGYVEQPWGEHKPVCKINFKQGREPELGLTEFPTGELRHIKGQVYVWVWDVTKGRQTHVWNCLWLTDFYMLGDKLISEGYCKSLVYRRAVNRIFSTLLLVFLTLGFGFGGPNLDFNFHDTVDDWTYFGVTCGWALLSVPFIVTRSTWISLTLGFVEFIFGGTASCVKQAFCGLTERWRNFKKWLKGY